MEPGLESIMQYLWQWRLYGSPDKQLTDGTPLRILHPGLLNTASGPDFFNSRVEIDGQQWAGNIELHLKASDWFRHGHHKDKAYDTVILHVVGESDAEICRTDGSPIPQLLLPFSADTAERYRTLALSGKPLRCASWISEVPHLNLADWMDCAGMERLEEKTQRMLACVKFTCGDWSQALFIVLARALGFGLNSEPLERLARQLPLSVAARHADSLFQLEALLLGLAGLLSEPRPAHGDAYYMQLRDEFAFLSHKYSLTPLPASVWKLSGTRPGNMPYRKLALLTRLLRGASSLFSRMIEAHADIDRLMEIFAVEFDGYWERHLTFGPPTTRSYRAAISPEMVQVLLVNVAAPLYRAYGIYTADLLTEELGQKLLTQLPPERNSVMKMWAEVAGIHPANAFESQALLYAKHNYCERSECLRCRIGHRLMRTSATIPVN